MRNWIKQNILGRIGIEPKERRTIVSAPITPAHGVLLAKAAPLAGPVLLPAFALLLTAGLLSYFLVSTSFEDERRRELKENEYFS